MDDILVASPTKEYCERDSLTVLLALEKGGHKVSRDKLQFCQKEVDYLGRRLCGNLRKTSATHLEAIAKASQPKTVSQMLTFLGMTGYSRAWICDYAIKAAPLREMIRAAGQNNGSANLEWNEKALQGFSMLKRDLQEAPALGNPDYSKPFLLYVAEKSGHACAVLMQDTPTGKQPIAYYSSKLDNVELGLPPCYQGLASAVFAFQKAAAITMGHPVSLFTSHQLHALLTSPRFVLTQARRTGYEVILSAPELTIQRCNTVNPATRMMVPESDVTHECIQSTEKFLKPRDDLHNQPIEADLTYFVDGSCFKDVTGNHAGYAVVQLHLDGSLSKVQAKKVPQPCSAQLAELMALTAACQLARDKRLNAYTDSAYAYGVCHINGKIWQQRGFKRADGIPVVHAEALASLLEAMMLPSALAIIKCASHQKNDSLVAKGNNYADEVAREVASVGAMAPLLVAGDCEPLTTLVSLIETQDAASVYEKSVWKKRGASKCLTDGHQRNLWRSPEGHFVLPLSLVKTAILAAHGQDHCHRGEVLRKLKAVWWTPFLAAMVDRTLHECIVCAQHNVRKSLSAPLGHIPIPEGPFRHLMMDHIDMIERVRGYRYVLVVIDRFSRWIEAVPTKGPDASSAAKFLCREVFPRFGIPDLISSDNGPAFVANIVKISMKILGIKQKFGCVYHPQSQGVVERANGTLKAKLAKIRASSNGKLNWMDALPLALM
ncbi:protein NYNRIN-like [Festucalex cinctus]